MSGGFHISFFNLLNGTQELNWRENLHKIIGDFHQLIFLLIYLLMFLATPSQQNFYFRHFLKTINFFCKTAAAEPHRGASSFHHFPTPLPCEVFLFWRSPFFFPLQLQAPSSAVPDINPTLPQPAPAVLVLTGTNPTSSKIYQRPFTF